MTTAAVPGITANNTQLIFHLEYWGHILKTS